MELTKVYVVQADNREVYEDYMHWTEGVFASEESAKKYISVEERRYDKDMQRINELEELKDRRYANGTYDSFEKYGLTAEEFEEYKSLQDYWSEAWRCRPHYCIKEYVVNN